MRMNYCNKRGMIHTIIQTACPSGSFFVLFNPKGLYEDSMKWLSGPGIWLIAGLLSLFVPKVLYASSFGSSTRIGNTAYYPGNISTTASVIGSSVYSNLSFPSWRRPGYSSYYSWYDSYDPYDYSWPSSYFSSYTPSYTYSFHPTPGYGKSSFSSSSHTCDTDGYKKNDANGSCDRCPPHSSSSGGYCFCDTGYTRNYSSGKCEKVNCPDNSTLEGSSCICNTGYMKNYSSNICEGLSCPDNSSQSGSMCICHPGYEKNDATGECEPYTSSYNNPASTATPYILFDSPAPSMEPPSLIPLPELIDTPITIKPTSILFERRAPEPIEPIPSTQ